MASPSNPTTLFLLALLFTAAALPAHGQLFTVRGIQVGGLLVCSATGNLSPSCTNCRGIPGVNVTVTCNGGTITVGRLVTDANGFFNGLLTVADGLAFDNGSSPCNVTVQLPIASCSLLPASGILRAPLTFTGTVVNGVVGLVAQTVAGAFVLIQQIVA